MTRYAVEPVELPTTIHTVAAQNPDGTYTFYMNTLCPDDVQQTAIREMIHRIEEVADHG